MTKKIIVILMLLLGVCSVGLAKDQFYHILDIAVSAKYTTEPLTVTANNGLSITPIAPIYGILWNSQLKNERIYYYNGAIAAVNGNILKMTNNSTDAIIVKWNSSVISLNGFSMGMPFLAGMKYRDAGNPATTPDSIIPPGMSVSVNAFLSNVRLMHDSWVIDGAPLLRDAEIPFSYYIKTVTADGSAEYITVIVPGIKATKE